SPLCSAAYFSESGDAPAVYRPAVKVCLRCHHAVPLEDEAMLHYKARRSQRVDIFERIAFDCDEVRGKASFNRAALVINIRDLITVDGHDFKDFLVGDACSLPALQEV